MKFEVTGDPHEIAEFFQQMTSMSGFINHRTTEAQDAANLARFDQQMSAPETSDAPQPRTPPKFQRRRKKNSGRAHHPQSSATKRNPVQESQGSHNRPLFLKERISQFLEKNSPAKIAAISHATGISSRLISPRLAELVRGGEVLRLTDKRFGNVFQFVRHWQPSAIARTRKKRRDSAWLSETTVATFNQSRGENIQEKPQSQKQRIIEYLSTVESAKTKDIRRALLISSGSVTGRLTKMVYDGIVKKSGERFSSDYSLVKK